MIPKNTAAIIRHLLRTSEKHNINQIAKATKTSVGSAFKILKELEKEKIAVPEDLGNAKFYSLNLDNPEGAKICELLLLEEKRKLHGIAKVYAESLEKFKHAEIIALFGSILKKKEFNDVDVLFVTDNVKEVQALCLDISKVRTKPIVPLILKKKDLSKELKNKKEAIVSIINESIILKGESAFIEVIKHAKS
ncbi:MAG: hypothetical protein ABIJ21_03470 [Nanoarchaeota archaeon]